MKRKTIFLSLLLSVAMMMSVMITNAGAAFTDYAKQTKLFTSYAGYDIHVDDFYNLIKQYVGKKYTYSYNADTGKIDRKINRKGNSVVVTSECTMDANGTIQISQYIQDGWCPRWKGVSITKDGNLNMTISQSGSYYADVAWNANTNIVNIYKKVAVARGVNTFQNTYYGLNYYDYDNWESWEVESDWIPEIIREYNWKSLSYTFYVPQ